MSVTIQECTITPDIVTVPKAEWDKITRIVAAAESLYEATRDYLNAWEDTDELADKLHKALADYANAKEPQ